MVIVLDVDVEMLDFRPPVGDIHSGTQPHFTGDDTLNELVGTVSKLSSELDHPALEITIPSDELERMFRDMADLPQ
jgi:hypothetical protein